MQLKNIPKVRNMLSSRSDSCVPNQFVISNEVMTVFQSYDTIIAVILKGDLGTNQPRIHLNATKWNFSATTSKYRNQFLGETTKETKKKILDKTYGTF